MFQTFEESGDSRRSAPRVAALRSELERRGLAGVLVPRTDEYQNEYLPAGAERLAWLTGFTGSAGFAVVLRDRAALFVDGRYTLQARDQVDPSLFEIRHLIEDGGPEAWLREHVAPGERLGFDPWLHTLTAVRRLERLQAETGFALEALPENLVDLLWTDRPGPPLGEVSVQPETLAGRSAADKLDGVRDVLGRDGQDAVVVASPDSLAWLFNIRGRDVPHTPLALGFAVVSRDGRATLAMTGEKLGPEVRSHLSSLADIVEPEEFPALLDALGAAGAEVRLDPATTAQAIADRLTAAGATVADGQDPCILPKARKTEAEIEGARRAHLRDAAAMCRFLAWLDREAPAGGVDEIAAAQRLEAERARTGELLDISFDTISAAGPHAAIPHYRVTTASNRRLEPGGIYLVDSGGQYRDGTTDITRTVAVGTPTEAMRRHATLVLKGHIAVALARFPVGTTGAQLDTLARYRLWQDGLDFDHGTGHGIGSYLSVHEGPQRIAKTGHVALEPGMILSNEPGYYRAGEYGIRIENLVVVRDAEPLPGNERPFLRFEVLSHVPIDRRLVAPELLTAEERDWLDRYHKTTREVLAPELDARDTAWLEAATAPL